MHTAIEKGNVEIANLLLSNKTINVNIKTILNLINLNKIQQIFEYNFKLQFAMKFHMS